MPYGCEICLRHIALVGLVSEPPTHMCLLLPHTKHTANQWPGRGITSLLIWCENDPVPRRSSRCKRDSPGCVSPSHPETSIYKPFFIEWFLQSSCRDTPFYTSEPIRTHFLKKKRSMWLIQANKQQKQPEHMHSVDLPTVWRKARDAWNQSVRLCYDKVTFRHKYSE